MSPHLARAAIVGAGQPAWPIAVEVLSERAGDVVRTARGELVFGPGGDPDDDRAVVARLAGAPVAMDADGGVTCGGEAFGSLEEALAAWGE